MMLWNESTDCCSWEGVTCDWLNGHVIGLDLSCNTLHGTIEANSSLFHLRQLQRLNLALNDFNFSRISSSLARLQVWPISTSPTLYLQAEFLQKSVIYPN
ncbi:hypothetical protein ACSBR2_012437 [Camellia fascicularis]